MDDIYLTLLLLSVTFWRKNKKLYRFEKASNFLSKKIGKIFLLKFSYKNSDLECDTFSIRIFFPSNGYVQKGKC